MLKTVLSITTLALIISACNQAPAGSSPADTPTSGTIKIGIDESYIPLMDTEIYMFESLYDKAHLMAEYKPEDEIIKDLLNDSIRAAVIGRDLTEKEYAYFKSKTHPAKTTPVAVDGVALIVNPENTDSMLTMGQVASIFSGAFTKWNQLNPANTNGDINVVFDNNGSANFRYITDQVLFGKPMTKNAYAQSSNAEVIEYVSKNKNAIGVISVAWISDHNDSTAMSFLSKVRTVAVAEGETAEPSEYKKPIQAYIFTKAYPMTRTVYFVTVGSRRGLGTGFAAFVAGEKGQLIIHKSGMVANQAPTRKVQMK